MRYLLSFCVIICLFNVTRLKIPNNGGNVRMKKRLLAILLTICMVAALLPTAAFAADGDVAQIDSTGYATLAEAFTAAKTGETITLLADVTNPGLITISDKKVTLNLNNHKITMSKSDSNLGRFSINGTGGLEVTGTGTVSGGFGAFYMMGASSDPSSTTATLKIDENVTVTDANYPIWVQNNGTASYGVKVDIYGTLVGNETIYVSGNITATTGTIPEIVVHEGASVTSTNKNNEAAYLAGYAKTTIQKNTTFASTAGADVICVAAGELTIEGGTFTGTNTVGSTGSSGGSVTTTTSGALYVVQHSTNLDVKVTINGGTFTGAYAVMQEEQSGYGTTPKKVEIKINDGTFTALNADMSAVSKKSEAATLEISGGKFSTDPGSYVVSGKIAAYNDDGDGMYTVRDKVAEEVLEKPATGTDVDVTELPSDLSEETVAAIAQAAASVEVPDVVNAETAEEAVYNDQQKKAAVDALEAAKLTVPEDAVITVYTQVYLDVKATDYNATDKTLTMNITPKTRLVASYARTADDIELEEGNGQNAVAYGETVIELTEPVEMSVTLPKETFGGKNVYVKHVSSGGTYYYKSTAKDNGELTFTSDHGFSPFSFSLKDYAAAWIGANGYDSLQEAVDTAVDKGTIDVTNENSDTIYVGSTKTFTLTNASNFKGQVVASNIYTTVTKDVDKENGTITYTCVYTAPSVPVYRVVVNDAEGGKIKASANKAAEGATIVLTPIADDEESELETLAVVDEDGNDVTLTKRANGTYSFVMPAKAVTVTGTFTIVADPEEPDEDEEPGDEEEEVTVFTDVDEDAYYAEAVAWAVANEITKGTSETTFSPDDDCTRAQVVTFLWRYAGKPEPTTTENPFTDVEEGTDYYKAILWAYENGITTGTSETTFSPDETCTRAQVVTFLWRYEGELTYEEAETFTDVAEDAYYAKAVAWAVHEWITKGTGDGQFSPDETCSRGQVVTFLYRDTAEG
jgi:hypothetical protein